jgi:hypothetical protein
MGCGGIALNLFFIYSFNSHQHPPCREEKEEKIREFKLIKKCKILFCVVFAKKTSDSDVEKSSSEGKNVKCLKATGFVFVDFFTGL